MHILIYVGALIGINIPVNVLALGLAGTLYPWCRSFKVNWRIPIRPTWPSQGIIYQTCLIT